MVLTIVRNRHVAPGKGLEGDEGGEILLIEGRISLQRANRDDVSISERRDHDTLLQTSNISIIV